MDATNPRRKLTDHGDPVLETVFEAMADGVIIFDNQGHVLRMNSAARALLGHQSQPDYSLHNAFERTSPFDVRDEQHQPLSVEQWPLLRVLKGEVLAGTTVQDIVIHNLEGRDIHLNISGAPVRNEHGHIDGAIIVMRDVTERRSLELALRETQAHMDEFLSVVSHELRTPMTTIKGNIQLAKIRLNHFLRNILPDDPLQDNLAEINIMLQRAERQVNVQNRLIRDLLDISHIQAGQIEMQPVSCDLLTIVKDAIEDLRSITPTRSILAILPTAETPLVGVQGAEASPTLVSGGVEAVTAAIPIFADPERIAQVISNYITNALKYSAADRPIEVRLQQEINIARLSVTDQGPGLSPSEQERVWHRFYRVESIARQPGFPVGLGLGLHICRAIIEQHHGQVGVHSAKGKGSTFWFTLPLAHHLKPSSLQNIP